jgi:outer membrane immunogenic protein
VLGYGFAVNQFVMGPEADIAGSTLSGYSGSCGVGLPAHVCGGSVYVISDVRGRVGLPFGQFMPFIAGGLAVDDIHAEDTLFGVSGTHWEAGWTIGAGVDYKITPQISLRLEYLYQDFGRQTFFDIVPGVPERVRTDLNIIRGGIVWNFETAPPPTPVIAKY